MTFRAALLLVLIGLGSVAGCAVTSGTAPAPPRTPPVKHYDPLP